jgi:hypothetical protein
MSGTPYQSDVDYQCSCYCSKNLVGKLLSIHCRMQETFLPESIRGAVQGKFLEN